MSPAFLLESTRRRRLSCAGGHTRRCGFDAAGDGVLECLEWAFDRYRYPLANAMGCPHAACGQHPGLQPPGATPGPVGVSPSSTTGIERARPPATDGSLGAAPVGWGAGATRW